MVVSYPDAKHDLVSTASNVIIVVLDVTGSMQDWPQEIFRRLPLLFNEAVTYLGSDDLEILFVAMGDARTDCFPIQVAQFARGEALDKVLASFYMKCGGGGQGTESHELVAYHLLKRVDTSSAQNVFTFFVTDEAACDFMDWDLVKDHIDMNPDPELEKTERVFEALSRKTKLYTILCETKNTRYSVKGIKSFWDKHIGSANVLPLSESRRVVDVILATIATVTGQMDTFTTNLMGRQQGSQYAESNLRTVQKSIALIGGSLPSVPVHKKKPIL
jgi:hypothetical protein